MNLEQAFTLYYNKEVRKITHVRGFQFSIVFTDNTCTFTPNNIKPYAWLATKANIARVCQQGNTQCRARDIDSITPHYDAFFDQFTLKVHFKYQGSYYVSIPDLYDEFIKFRQEGSRNVNVLGIDLEFGVATVQASNPKDPNYYVTLLGDKAINCTCSDHAKHHFAPCKHMMAVEQKLESIEIEAQRRQLAEDARLAIQARRYMAELYQDQYAY